MTIVNVNSGAIQHVEYHKKKREFDVLFKDGTMASYKNVPEEVYREFLSAGSKGRYLNYNIRGVYDVA